MSKTKDQFDRNWIIENSCDIVRQYEYGVLTIRGLHYRLVSRGMTNTIQHYKRVVSAMEKARWDGLIRFEQFSDHERGLDATTKADEVVLEDEIVNAKEQIKSWMSYYARNRWENQQYYPEVFIEKKALIGVFKEVCDHYDIALGACKGYPSLTFLNEAYGRFREAKYVRGQRPVILYFGDYDPSGEDIPRSIECNLYKFGIAVDVKRIALMEDQVIDWELPPAPVKSGDSRSSNWDGIGQVELDAVEPMKLRKLCQDAIDSVFDVSVYEELKDNEKEELDTYRKELKKYVGTL